MLKREHIIHESRMNYFTTQWRCLVPYEDLGIWRIVPAVPDLLVSHSVHLPECSVASRDVIHAAHFLHFLCGFTICSRKSRGLGGGGISWRPFRSGFKNLHLLLSGSFTTLLNHHPQPDLFISSSSFRFSSPFYSPLSRYTSEQVGTLGCHSSAVRRNIMSAPDVLLDLEKVDDAPALSTTQQPNQQQPRKLTALERNNLKWESHKEEIRSIYIE